MDSKPKHPGGRPRLFPTPESLQSAVDGYFKSCWEETEEGSKQVRPYTMSGLANSLGVDRKTLLNYEDRDEYFLTIKKAREKVHQYVEEYLFQGRNTAGAIFNLKNNFGWKDQQDHKVDLSDPLQVLLDKIATNGSPKPKSDDTDIS